MPHPRNLRKQKMELVGGAIRGPIARTPRRIESDAAGRYGGRLEGRSRERRPPAREHGGQAVAATPMRLFPTDPKPRPERRLPRSLVGLLLAACVGCTRIEETWYDSGVLRSRGPVDIFGGERHGEWIFQHPNGEPKERGRYDHGLRTGTWTQWFPDGQARSRGLRVPDRATGTSPRHGPWIFWHENGIVAARGIYEHGSREGLWELSIDDGGLDGDHSGVHHEGRLLGLPEGGDDTLDGDDDPEGGEPDGNAGAGRKADDTTAPAKRD